MSLRHSRWLIDHDKDAEGMRVIADLHGGDPEDLLAQAEYQEIKERVMADVSHQPGFLVCSSDETIQRGEDRTYAAMWSRYKRRVLLAMSSQMFAQLVSTASGSRPRLPYKLLSRMGLMVRVEPHCFPRVINWVPVSAQ